MKTAISIPDPLFEAAERVSKRLGISRSQFYAQAVATYLKSQHLRGVKERLDAVYGCQDSELDSILVQMQDESLLEEDWSCVAEKSGGRR